jgi:polysaccharide biosynthesis protein PslH
MTANGPARQPGAWPLRVLVLAPFPPDEEGGHGGARAVAGLVAALSRHHHVALVYLRGVGEPEASERMRDCCDPLVEVARDERGGGGRLAQKVRNGLGLLRGRPLWVSKWSSAALPSALRDVIRNWRPDIVQVEFEVMARYLDVAREADAPVVVTVHDPGYASAKEAVARGRLSPLAHLDRSAWWRFERKILGQVGAAVCFTPRDTQALLAVRAQVHVECIPIGQKIPQHPADPAGDSAGTVLFIGNFMHPPNRDAAAWLVESILPRVRVEVPEAHAILVGDAPPPIGQDGPGVQYTVRVPDIWPFLDRADVVVAPIRLGGGMRVKLLEALAAGKAVVATPRAAEGLAVTHGRELLLAESERDFAAAIVRLLGDIDRRMGLARAARTWAEANLSWQRSARDYEHLYRALLERRYTARADS